MAISNKGQFSQLFSGKVNKCSTNEYSNTLPAVKPEPDYTCNLPKLVSHSWVTTHNRQKSQPLKDTGIYGTKRLYGNVWVTTWVKDPKKLAEQEMKKVLRAQLKQQMIEQKAKEEKEKHQADLPKGNRLRIKSDGTIMVNGKDYIDLSALKKAV